VLQFVSACDEPSVVITRNEHENLKVYVRYMQYQEQVLSDDGTFVKNIVIKELSHK
jgi:hypothetical protein